MSDTEENPTRKEQAPAPELSQSSYDLAGISIQSKLLPFWRENPRLWFAQFEAIVEPLKTSDDQKFRYALGVMQAADIQQVSDIILKPNMTGKYSALKTRLLSVYEESASRQFQKLISGLELGDQKPTQLLRRMRELGKNMVPDDGLRVIWMNQLPVQVRTVLSVNNESSLDILAAMADKMLEHTEPVTVAAVTRTSEAQAPPSSDIALFEKLSQKLENLTLEIAALRSSSRQPYRRPFRSRSRSRSRSRPTHEITRKPGDPGWLCRYHFRFGDRARKCESPCSKNHNTSEN
ncbi:uncharacterized protein LOC125226949 [Leguminivora glycinivorella]|uniref:uncharacterized protein LOC125226949 n=1 Tax=Leguminivora glycinivorella TaxID=1035111 RepID=UPI00200D552E|nr:uncharacterized protein LOC125226949 [Leguminivora glycinivorella]